MTDARTIRSAVLEKQTELLSEYVRDFKNGGGKVLGYSCAATPVEVIEAAGILPYRIKALGNPDTYLADGEMSILNCSFCRSCLNLALDGTYDFLDGIIETNGCDHMRVMFENWNRVKTPGFFHYLRVPHFSSEDSISYFAGELEILAEAMGEKFSVEVTEEALIEAMKRQRRVRQLFDEICALREEEKPRITGSEMLALVIRGSSMMSVDFIGLMERYLEESREAEGVTPRARLLVCGAATDETEWFEEIENMGGIVVADALCFGSRAFCQPEVEDRGPFRSLAESYLGGLFCPRMYTEYPNRRDYVTRIARRAGVDGAIVLYNKFCDLHGVDAVLLRKDLEAMGLPVLILEKEYSAKADLGRVKTRVQAFMERIGGAS